MPFYNIDYFHRVLGILLCNTVNEIFPGLVGRLSVSASLDSKYILETQTSPKNGQNDGLRPSLLSCLTKFSRPKDLDCTGRDKGCCLLVKLSQQRKKVMRRKSGSSDYVSKQGIIVVYYRRLIRYQSRAFIKFEYFYFRRARKNFEARSILKSTVNFGMKIKTLISHE